MAVSYKKLWKLLIDHDMKKKDLAKVADISNYTITKMSKGENVTVETFGDYYIRVVQIWVVLPKRKALLRKCFFFLEMKRASHMKNEAGLCPMKLTFGACFTKGTLCFILNFSSMLRVCKANASCERSECFVAKS